MQNQTATFSQDQRVEIFRIKYKNPQESYRIHEGMEISEIFIKRTIT